MTINYQIEFYSFWHVSSGLSSGTYADVLVNKTEDDFPFIPGRTLKGLLREGAEFIHAYDKELITEDFIFDVFGKEPTAEDLKLEKKISSSSCFFSSAFLSDCLKQSIPAADRQFFYETIASTKINEHGTAEAETLRNIEVIVPLLLNATIENFPDKEGYKKQIDYCLKWVKRLGLGRTRGLGRCRFSLTN